MTKTLGHVDDALPTRNAGATGLHSVPYSLVRGGVLMRARTDDPFELEGVLNPGSGTLADGRVYLLPRMVAAGNVSRVGLSEVVIEAGVPTGVRREGVVLAPDRAWERGAASAGTEDPRVTWVPSLDRFVMTYIAFGPLGPKPALAISRDLRSWDRLGPLHFAYDDGLDSDLNLYPNKDVVVFPEIVPDRQGQPSFAMLHRPMWDLGAIRSGEGVRLPGGLRDDRLGIWISYVPADAVLADIRKLVSLTSHTLVAMPEQAWEALKIGSGPPPLRVPEGWLLLYHGVSGRMVGSALTPQPHVNYAAGAMILDPRDPSKVIARSAYPLLSAEIPEELTGTVPRVVFPTAIEQIGDRTAVFYGMADSAIGVAFLERTPALA